MKDYANGADRTRLAYLRDVDCIYSEFINGNLLTDAERTEMKHARTRHKKAMKLLAERLPDDFKKIDRMLKDNIIVMKPKIQEVIDKRAIMITDDRLRDILEIMISDHCTGCSVENWKDCIIYELNDSLDVSSLYDEPKGLCPYRYMMEQEKALNPTYGTIFKEVEK